MESSHKQTKRIALCAILSGLSLAVLYIGALSGIFDLCAVIVGALGIAFVVLEMVIDGLVQVSQITHEWIDNPTGIFNFGVEVDA